MSSSAGPIDWWPILDSRDVEFLASEARASPTEGLNPVKKGHMK